MLEEGFPETEPKVSYNIGRAAFIDLETTGLKAEYNEIIELAIVLFNFNRDTGKILGIVKEYSGLREPNRSIPKEATKVHGLTKKQLKGYSLDNSQITDIVNQAEFIVAHNASFDYPFAIKYMNIFEQNPWYCSLVQINWFAGGAKSKSLAHLLDRHGIVNPQQHRALYDVKASIELMNVIGISGQTYFYELIQNKPIPKSNLMRLKPIGVRSKTEKPKPKKMSTGAIIALLAVFPLFGLIFAGLSGLILFTIVAAGIFYLILRFRN